VSAALELRAQAAGPAASQFANLPLLGVLEHSSSGSAAFWSWAKTVDDASAGAFSRLTSLEEDAVGSLLPGEVTPLAAALEQLEYEGADAEDLEHWHDVLSHALVQASRAGTGVVSQWG
jgi:hypothetical protein